MPRTDQELLKDFVASADEASFSLLAKRHLGLIYGAALRRSGNREIAEEAAQNVLSLLVRKAADLVDDPGRLPGWLHRAATLEAANLSRSEFRHRRRLQQHFDKHAMNDPIPDPAWDVAKPQLDDALQDLSEKDRRLVIMHYFQGMTHKEIAESVGKSAAAVQRQCHRCLDKLARLLKKRGASISAVALGSLLASEAAKAAPATLLSQLPAAAFAAPGTTSLPLVTKSILLMTAKQKAIIAAASVALVAAVPIGLQQAKISQLEEEVRESAEPDGESPVIRNSTLVSAALPRSRKDIAAKNVSGPLSEVFKRLHGWDREILRMSDEEFGHRLAGLILGTGDADHLAETALMLESLSAENALATYRAFKTGRGLDPWTNDQRLRPMLKMMGAKTGRPGLDLLLAEYPDGIAEISSFLNGWTGVSADESLAWLNDLPSDSKIHRQAMKGVYWSVGERGPQFAGKAFSLIDQETMEPGDLRLAGWQMAGSLLANHGMDGIDEWAQTLPEEFKAKAVEWSLWRNPKPPINEFVPWLATHAHRSETLSNRVSSKAGEWAKSDPAAAITWAAEYGSNGIDAGAADVLGVVGRVAGPERLEEWLGRNVSHPEAGAVQGVLDQAKAAHAEE